MPHYPEDPLVFVDGATAPGLEFHIRRRGLPVPLGPYIGAGKSITARIRRGLEVPDLLTKTLAADVDPLTGIARLAWAAGDLVSKSATEEALCELEVLLNDGTTTEVSPAKVRFKVRPRVAA